MTAFLWTMVILCGIDVVVKIAWLACRFPMGREPGATAVDVIVGGVIMCWAIVLLMR